MAGHLKKAKEIAEAFANSDLGKSIGASAKPIQKSMTYQAKYGNQKQSYYNMASGRRNEKEIKKAERTLKRITGGASLDPHRKKQKDTQIDIDKLISFKPK